MTLNGIATGQNGIDREKRCDPNTPDQRFQIPATHVSKVYSVPFKGFSWVFIPLSGLNELGYAQSRTEGNVKYYLFSTCARIFYENF
jgi:hypothetical protein